MHLDDCLGMAMGASTARRSAEELGRRTLFGSAVFNLEVAAAEDEVLPYVHGAPMSSLHKGVSGTTGRETRNCSDPPPSAKIRVHVECIFGPQRGSNRVA